MLSRSTNLEEKEENLSIEQFSNIGYPYSYGDEGSGFSFRKNTKLMKISFLACGGLFLFASPAVSAVSAVSAVENELLMELALKIKALESVSGFEKKISPLGAASCAMSGYCLSEAKKYAQVGNMPVATAFVCGAAISICGNRVAAGYGY